MLVTGFDEGFACSIGLPIHLLQYILWVLLSFTVITSLQLVGVILVSALLIISAATALMITQRMNSLLLCSACLGIIAGVIGCYISFLGNQLPTGPLIVLSSTVIFIIVHLFNPKKGVFFEKFRLRKYRDKISLENTLKAVYQVLEKNHFTQDQINISDLAKRRKVSIAEAQREAKKSS